jgi:hypothetical protein
MLGWLYFALSVNMLAKAEISIGYLILNCILGILLALFAIKISEDRRNTELLVKCGWAPSSKDGA